MTTYNRPTSPAGSIIAAPPMQYDASYMSQLVIQLNLQFRLLDNPGTLQGTTLILTGLPTSATGLPNGSVWVDTANGNVLKVVI